MVLLDHGLEVPNVAKTKVRQTFGKSTNVRHPVLLHTFFRISCVIADRNCKGLYVADRLGWT